MVVLAVTDLVVGVSNDAVNFLNSAIGSRVATFRQIMIIASIGIMFGAIFSSGMMEVARKGVFNPQYFTIEEIMFLFAAVMLTDIILLDFYNSIALPTSTTVSIVFELLGSALAISFFSVVNNDLPIKEWANYINGSQAVVIIAGIFVSIVVAFALGWLIQYITRFMVTFQYSGSMWSFGSVFGALSVALITVFILLKGLQGVPFISLETLARIKSNVAWISLVSVLVSLVVFQFLIRYKNFNVYRFVTLLGTFALAMAFASNDLVNFIGVPIASIDSFMHWKGSGVATEDYMMTSLAEPVRTNQWFLIAAGIVMTLTLWFSKKAHSVVQTSINLGRQDEGAERFQANEISRMLVKSVMSMAGTINRMIPASMLERIDRRFTNAAVEPVEDPGSKPAFDLVRASVNLIVAAGIILVATSLKLPLSTTFVSFMVLMGTSLADRAWAKGSAVYRISGVFIVIGGWFLTAAIALTVSIIFASLLMSFKIYALVVLSMIALVLIFKNHIFYRHTRRKAEINLELADKWFKTDFYKIESEIREKLTLILGRGERTYHNAIEALIRGDRQSLGDLLNMIDEVEKTNEMYKVKLTQQIRDVPREFQDNSKILMYIYDMEEELLYALEHIIQSCERHISNLHPELTKEQIKTLGKIEKNLKGFMDGILTCFRNYTITDEDYENFKQLRKGLIQQIEAGLTEQIDLATSRNLSGKNSELMLTILFSNKNIVTTCSRLVKLFYKVKSTQYSNNLLDELLEE